MGVIGVNTIGLEVKAIIKINLKIPVKYSFS